MTERSLFLALLEIDDPLERSEYLEQACAGEPSLRARIEQLLQAHQGPGRFMERPAAALLPAVGAEPTVSEGPGTIVGSYKLLEQIGEGGFGVVFMAEQLRPVRRQVAVKVLKPGMDTRQVVARFEAERQVLALMAHPNIAHILDGGETASGRPYFVMELVRGVSITDFCDQNQLSVTERLELFIHVCHAVQHAHQKGVIHRDLKPTNLLVTMHDTIPVVKVIDFGIAKAMGHHLTDKTLFTNFAQLVGTPMYMSPEQAQLSGLDIDTRTDIYSLGVLLYELLTGTTPFERQRLSAVAYDEMRRIIREEEPPRPSTRMTALGLSAAAVSDRRRSDPKRLTQLCRGELDWIVMKALEKDRSRRYDTVGTLAADIEHYLRDEPVQACPPSRWYQFRKLARRHKRTFISMAALAAGALVALTALAVSNLWIRQEQARTTDEKNRADRAQQLAEIRAEEIRGGLERLKAANAMLDRGRWYVSETRMDDAHAAFSKAVDMRSDHASAWVELSELHGGLGLWELAAHDYARELKLRDPESTSRWYRHALLRLYQGDSGGYREVGRRMWARFRGTPNPFFLSELVRTASLSPETDVALKQPLSLAQQLLDSHENEWYYLYVSGMAHYRAGRHAEAARQLRLSLTAEPRQPARALSYPLLALAYQRQREPGKARAALSAAAAALDRWTEDMYRLGQNEERRVHHLGGVLRWPIAWWDWLEFHLFYREAKLLIEGATPPDDPRVRVLRARALAALRWNDKADAEYATALKLRPLDTELQLEAHRSRGYTCAAENRWREAAAEFRQALLLRPDEANLWLFRAVAHAVAGDADDYRETCAAFLQRFEKTTDLQSACLVISACVLSAKALGDETTGGPEERQGKLDVLARLVAGKGYFGASVQGAALYRAGKFADAVRCFESAAVLYRPRAWDWCFLAMAHARLGQAGPASRCLAEASRWIEAANSESMDDPTGTGPAWGGWPERVEYPLLLREAESVVKKPAS